MHVNSQNCIIDYSIRAFKSVNKITEIILVCPKDWEMKLSKNIRILNCLGGKTRAVSSMNGLNACSKETEIFDSRCCKTLCIYMFN